MNLYDIYDIYGLVRFFLEIDDVFLCRFNSTVLIENWGDPKINDKLTLQCGTACFHRLTVYINS
jgi:hypothetical protein